MVIQSKSDYLFYIQADKIALGVTNDSVLKCIKNYLLNKTYRYERILRRAEYFKNCKSHGLLKPLSIYFHYRAITYGFKLGFEIPLNVFGPGLSIAHHGPIIINSAVKVGDNCKIHPCVTIGTEAGHSNKAPIVGNNVFIGPGCVIFGEICIGNNVAIGANSVVNRSFLEGDISIAGVPAKIISNKGSANLLINATIIISAHLDKD